MDAICAWGGGTVVSNVAQRLAIRVDYLLIINVSGYETFYGVYIFPHSVGLRRFNCVEIVEE